MTNAELGKYLARKIFEIGDTWKEGDRTQRIALKGGSYYNNAETDLCGMCEISLAGVIELAMNEMKLDRQNI